MPVKAVFTDLGGTLLNNNHRISTFTADVLKKLRGAGVCFVVCTGRPYGDVFAQLTECGLDPDFIITSSGGRVHDRQRQVVFQRDLPADLVRRLIRIRSAPDEDGELVAAPSAAQQAEPAEMTAAPKKTFIAHLHRNAEVVTAKALPEVVCAYHDSVVTVDCGEALYDLSDEELSGVHYMWYLGEPAELAKLQKHLQKYYANDVETTFALPFSLDVVPANINKSVALRKVAELLKVPVEDVACFGDGMNDESMLGIAGHPFIMANGEDALKAAIPHAEVIGLNTEDGVAKKLVELFSL